MPRLTDTRHRMLRTAASLMRRQGYAATGWRQVVAESATTWGSQAHHFPGGKEQLAAEAVALAGAGYERMLRGVLAGRHPAEAVAWWTEAAAVGLQQSGWADGCPVATVALETAHTSDALAASCSSAFASWTVALADAMREHGAPAEQADRLAMVVLAAIEGALLLARARRDPAPLLVVGNELRDLLLAKMPPSAANE